MSDTLTKDSVNEGRAITDSSDFGSAHKKAVRRQSRVHTAERREGQRAIRLLKGSVDFITLYRISKYSILLSSSMILLSWIHLFSTGKISPLKDHPTMKG